MKLNLQPLITPSLPLTVGIYLIFFVLSVGLSVLFDDYPFAPRGLAEQFANRLLPFGALPASIATSLICVFNSMLLAQMNNRFAIIRIRTFMPTFVYLLLSVCWLPAYGNYVAALSSLCVLVAIYLTFGMYKNKESVEHAFLGFFFLGVSALLIPEFFILLLVFWIGFFILQAFSARVFFASVFGFLTPWILFLGGRYFLFNLTGFVAEMEHFMQCAMIFNCNNVPILVLGGTMVLILIAALVQITANDRQDSIMARNMLNFMKVCVLGLFTIAAFRHKGFVSYMPTIALLYAWMVAYIFTLLRSRFNAILFVGLLTVNFALALYLLVGGKL